MRAEKRIYEKGMLVELIKDKHSCLILKSCTRRIELQPKYLKEVKAGIREALDQCLNRYDYSLNGILLDYQNLSVIIDKDSGRIVGKYGEFVVSVKGEFFVFQPEIGNLLRGVVNVKTDSHVGCLVHKRFNAMILKPENVEIENWNCRNIQIGDEIVFEIADHVFSGHVPSIEGKISGEYLEKKLRKTLKKSRQTTSSGEHSQHNGHCSIETEVSKTDEKTVDEMENFFNSTFKTETLKFEESSNISPKKKKSESKIKMEVDTTPSDHEVKKKKKKRDKDKDKHKHKDKYKDKDEKEDKDKDKDEKEDEVKNVSREKEKESTKKKSEKSKSSPTKKDEIEPCNTESTPTKGKKRKLRSESQTSLDKSWKSELFSPIMSLDADSKKIVKEIDSESIAKGASIFTPDTSTRERAEEKPKKTPAKKPRLDSDARLKQRLINDMLGSQLKAEDKFDKPVTASTPKGVENISKSVDEKDSCMISIPKPVVDSVISKHKKKRNSSKSKSSGKSKPVSDEGRLCLINNLLDSVKMCLGVDDVSAEKSNKSETEKDVEDPILRWLRKSADKSAQEVQKSSKGSTSRLSPADSGFNSLADKFKINS